MNNQINPKYIINPNHRNNNCHKSQWKINKNDELSLFNLTYNSQWILTDNKNKSIGFGIKKNGVNQIELLGYSATIYGQLRVRELKIAKFVENQNIWHGYPADYLLNKADTPPNIILKMWINGNYINKKIMCKILKGQICNL